MVLNKAYILYLVPIPFSVPSHLPSTHELHQKIREKGKKKGKLKILSLKLKCNTTSHAVTSFFHIALQVIVVKNHCSGSKPLFSITMLMLGPH